MLKGAKQTRPSITGNLASSKIMHLDEDLILCS